MYVCIYIYIYVYIYICMLLLPELLPRALGVVGKPRVFIIIIVTVSLTACRVLCIDGLSCRPANNTNTSDTNNYTVILIIRQ